MSDSQSRSPISSSSSSSATDQNVSRSQRSGDGGQTLASGPSRHWRDIFWLAVFMLHVVVLGFGLTVLGLNRFQKKDRLNIDKYAAGITKHHEGLTEDYWPMYAVAGGVGTALGCAWLLLLGSRANQMMKFTVHILTTYLAVISVLCFWGEQFFWGVVFAIGAALQFLYIISVIDRLPFTMLVLQKSVKMVWSLPEVMRVAYAFMFVMLLWMGLWSFGAAGVVASSLLNIDVDPCAAILVFIVTGLLCVGIKESTQAQVIVTTANVCAMSFVIIAGGYLGFTTGWAGYELPTGYFPFGVDGMLAGSATVFFAYIGFDSVASTAEEVKNPQRDLPLGIGASLFLCCALYMMVSVVVVGLVPYYAMDPDTPISSAFASHGMQWAAYIIAVGTVTALCSTLLGSILPQPRILMAMARDGLLPPFFSEVNIKTQVPMKGTIVTGIGAAILAFIMDVSQLAGMVSVGTLLAFTMVAISVLILRYVPPDEVPLPSSLQGSIDSASLEYGRSGQGSNGEQSKFKFGTSMDDDKPLLVKEDASDILNEENRRKIAGWTIMLTCVGAFLLTYAASNLALPRSLRFSLCGVGGTLLLSGLIVLTCIDQDDARHSFGHTGGFICPFVPLIPIACILINIYLLINLGTATWARVSIWLIIGVLVYVFYGRTHSSLRHSVYVPAAHADEIYNDSVSSVA